MNKECEWCGNELLNTKSPRRRFCNDICRARFRRSNAESNGSYIVKCGECGIEFKTYHNTKKYCSEECRKKTTVPRSAERVKLSYDLNCEECNTEFESTNKQYRFCSYKCKTKNRNKLNELQRRKYYIEGDNTISLSKLIDKENNLCYICGTKCNSNDFVIDDKGTVICGNDYPSIEHVIPLSKGGKHEWNNVKLAHRGCNIKKSNNYQENLG